MKRKVNKVGTNTLTVSLPTKWAKKYHINSGDDIEVEEKENQVIISTGKGTKVVSKVEVDGSNMENYILQLFVNAAHKKGHDEVVVKYKSPEQLEHIRSRTTNLLGYEIVEQDDKKCLIKNVSGDMEKEYESILRRSFLVTKNMFENIIQDLETNDFNDTDSIIALEKTNNRLTNYCERILVKNLYKGSDSFGCYVVIWNLESIADDLRDFLNLVKEQKNIPIFSKSFIDLFKEVYELYKIYYDLFYSFSIDKINNLKTKSVELKNKLLKTMKKDKELPEYYFFLTLSTSRIYDMMASTLSLNMDKYVKNEY